MDFGSLVFASKESTRTKKVELVFIVVIAALFVLVFHELFTAERMSSHDTIRWYAVYHFFADSFSNGIFAYWDPYDYCGQPFYYNLGILRIYEPITLGFIMLGRVFDVSFLTVYHWEYMTRIWLVALGVYLCFRQLNKYLVSNLLVFSVFLFSSFTITCLRQNGVLYTFFWTPWAMYFLVRLLREFSPYNAIGFSFFVGLSLTSYQGVYLLTYLFIFGLTLLINKRAYLISIFKNSRNLAPILVGITMMIILALPLFSLYVEKDKIVPSLRLSHKADIDRGINLTYESLGTAGSHSSLADFSQLLFPGAAWGYFIGLQGLFASRPWLRPSECFLYVGILPFLLALAGVFFRKGEYRVNFLLTLILIGLLMLGPKGVVHRLIHFFFYPLRYARHMHLFSGFFIFTLFYFVGQGVDFVLDRLSVKYSG